MSDEGERVEFTPTVIIPHILSPTHVLYLNCTLQLWFLSGKCITLYHTSINFLIIIMVEVRITPENTSTGLLNR